MSLLVALVASAAGCARFPDTSEMNVLLITLEDCTTRAIGAYGGPSARTPNIDAFAATAVRFDRAYCQFPSCNPSRTSFLTGMRPRTTRVLSNKMRMERRMPEGIVTLPELLDQDDWYLASVGKLFHRSPPQFGVFDRVSHWPVYDPAAAAAPAVRKPRPADPEGKTHGPGVGQPKLERTYSDQFGASPKPETAEKDFLVGRGAVRTLQALNKGKKRFFLSVGSKLPHTPLLAPKRFLDQYPLESFELPPRWDRPRWGFNPDIFTDRHPTEEEARACIRAYHACVSFVDEQVGKIMAALEEIGLADNTIVILMADHGFRLGGNGYWSKYSFYEEVTKVPLLVRVPGNPANGSVCSGIVELVDMMPTILELGGIAAPADLQSTSFVPLLENPERPWKRGAFTMLSSETTRWSVRTDRYRFSRWVTPDGDPKMELFDLESDPWELRDLAKRAEYADVVAEHAALLDDGWAAALPPEGD